MSCSPSLSTWVCQTFYPSGWYVRCSLTRHLTDLYRKCCSSILEVSKERSIWLRVVQELSSSIPLPPELRPRDTLESLDTDEIFRLALRTHWTERRWEKPRIRVLDRTTRSAPDASKPTILLGMQVLLDRWLVLVYGEGVIQVHDILDEEVLKPVAEIEWDRAQGSQWSSFAMALDTVDNEANIILAVARCVPYVRQTAPLS